MASRLTCCIDSKVKPAEAIETKFLLGARIAQQPEPEFLLAPNRADWGFETGFHLRVDVIAGEDLCRIHHRAPSLSLAMIRRARVNVAIS